MRSTVVVASVALAATYVPAAHAATPEYPRDSCAYRVEDNADDAPVDYSPVAGTPVAPGASVPSLDVTSVTLRLTDTELQAFVHVTKLEPLGTGETARRYEVSFTKGSKSYVFEQALVDPTTPDALKPSGPFPKAHGAAAFTGVTGALDPATGYVWISAPRAAIEADLGAKLAEDDVFDGIVARTFSYSGTQSWRADEASVSGITYVVGDDFCFGPPPAMLDALTVAPVQYGDAAAVSVVVLDDDGEALAGKQVDYYVNGVLAGSATSDDDGLAAGTVTTTLPAGTYPVVARFAGDATAGKARAKGSLTVSTEVTRLGPLGVARPTKTTRVVTATLVDDDAHAVPGQRVDFYVNGHKVATVVIDARGRAVCKSAKPGQRVQARYAGAAGRYRAAASPTVTV